VSQVELSRSDAPAATRAGACREGKGRVPLPVVVVDLRHRGFGRHRGTKRISTRPKARGLGGLLHYQIIFSVTSIIT